MPMGNGSCVEPDHLTHLLLSASNSEISSCNLHSNSVFQSFAATPFVKIVSFCHIFKKVFDLEDAA